MLIINKSYFSLICGGGKGINRRVKKSTNEQRELEQLAFKFVKGMTAEEAHDLLNFIPVEELRTMFKFNADGRITEPRLNNDNWEAIFHEFSDRNRALSRR